MSTAQTPSSPTVRRPRRASRVEIGAAAVYVAVLLVLVALEPDILKAPFASVRAVVATFGGALLLVVGLAVMIRYGVPPVVRVMVVAVPVVLVSWWLLEPYFVDDVVNEEFTTSIAEQRRAQTTAPAKTSDVPSPTTTSLVPAGPQLLGSGRFVGLAGHAGTGDAGIFRDEGGELVLRLENLDIENGPDLQLYLVAGAESYSPDDGSVHLGALKGNQGNQTYAIPRDFAVPPGSWTVLVWCEAFTVEFVGATLTVA